MSDERLRECKKIPSHLHQVSSAPSPLQDRPWALKGSVTVMLLSLTLTLVYLTRSSQGLARAQVERLLSYQERLALGERLSPQVAHLIRRAQPKPHVHLLGGELREVRALQLGEGLWLSASANLSLAPLEEQVALLLSSAPSQGALTTQRSRSQGRLGERQRQLQRRAEAATPLTPLLTLPREGLTLLTRPPLSAQARARLTHEALKHLQTYELTRAEGTLRPMLRLWALGLEGGASEVRVSARGEGAEAFFWRASAPLSPGEPLFDEEGRWVSLSVGGGLLLPLSAFIELRSALGDALAELSAEVTP